MMWLKSLVIAALAAGSVAVTAPASAQQSGDVTVAARTVDKDRSGKVVPGKARISRLRKSASGTIRARWLKKSQLRRSLRARGSWRSARTRPARRAGTTPPPQRNPLEEQFQESMRKLGLRMQKPTVVAAFSPAAPVTAAASPYSRFDRDGDGYVSRREYFRGRFRTFRTGRQGDARRMAAQSRLQSRFRVADSDRDGRLSGEELNNIGDPRF